MNIDDGIDGEVWIIKRRHDTNNDTTMMQPLYAIPIACLVLYIILRIFLRVGFNALCKKLCEKFEWKITADKIRLTKIINLQIEKEGFITINVDKIAISSKLFNKECLKLFGIIFGTLSIELCSNGKFPPKHAKKKSPEEVSKAVKLSFLTKFFLQHIYVRVNNLIISKKLRRFILVWSSDVQFKAYGYNQLEMHVEFQNSKLTIIHQDQPVGFATHSFDIRVVFEKLLSIETMKCEIEFKSFHMDFTGDLLSSLKEMKEKDLGESVDFADETAATSETSVAENKQSFQNIMNKLPMVLKFTLDNITLKYKSNQDRELQIDWNCVIAWQRLDTNEGDFSLDLLGLVVNGTNHCKILLCKQITYFSKVTMKEDAVGLINSVNIDSCHVDYIFEEISYWENHFIRILPQANIKKNQPTSNTQRNSLLDNSLLEVNVLLENCSCDVYFTLEKCFCHPLYSFSSRQFNLFLKDVSPKERKFKGEASLVDTYVYVNLEDIIDDIETCSPCIIEHDHPYCVPSSQKHSWGRLIEIGNANVKCSCDDGEENSFDIAISFIAIEWSYAMGLSMLKLFENYLKNKPKQREKNEVDSIQQTDETLQKQNSNSFSIVMGISMENVNFICPGKKEGGYDSLICKFDKGSVSMNRRKATDVNMKIKVDDIVLAQLIELQNLKTGDALVSQQSSKYEKPIVTLDEVESMLHIPGTCEINLTSLSVMWTTNKHMALYEQITDVSNFLDDLKRFQTRSSKVESFSSQKSKKSISQELQLSVKSFSLQAETAVEHSFSLMLNSIIVVVSKNNNLLQTDSLSVCFDEKEIFQFETIQVEKLSENCLTQARSEFKNLSITNSGWDISIGMAYIFFPYAFNFSESLHKVQLIFKMLKKLHKKPKPPNYVEPLPPDLNISIADIVIEFEDDPFEVKLIDNYMLLTDEMEQAYEREHKLEMKLDQIKSEKATMVSGKKVDDLRRNLKEKNAQIYIERSKEMYVDREPRKALFTILLKNIQFAIFADYSTHGELNILNHMEKIDSDSDIPEEISFTTLWARTVNGKIEILKMVIRDFPQPLVFIEDFSMKGMLLGAEETGDKMSSSEYIIDIGEPWESLEVSKNMPPLKYFYDLKWYMSACQVAWGANFEPAFAMVSLAFDLLSKASIDKSPPLPFFDKIRYLLHGNLKADIADLNIILNASNDPYNTTEKLEIEWSAVTLEWTNGNITIDGDFDMYTRTASKYDDSHVMHFPSFKLSMEMEWVCNGDPNGHHFISPTNPKYIHMRENKDSYYYFRSLNLNMNVVIDSSSEKTMEQLIEDPPAVFLYASTFKWFQTYQAVNVTRVSRPIKRGVLFKNVKPKKVALGRHYKLVNTEFQFPCLNLTYWGSFQKEAGFEAHISTGHLSISYQVFISPHPDGERLIRRPVANWIIRGLTSKLENTNLFLLESIKSNTDDDFADADVSDDDLLCINEEGELRKHYLFSVYNVAYEKQHVEEMFTHKLLLNGFKGAWTAINRKLVFELLDAYARMQNLKKVLSAVALKITTESTSNHNDKGKEKSNSETADNSFTKSPVSRMQTGHGALLLQQLVSEQSSKFMAQVEEGDSAIDMDSSYEKPEESDIIQKNWHIEFVNSQVLLHGTETNGAIILTSETATILNCLHRPVLDSTLKLNKVSWRGHFLNLQYFSTVQNFKDITVNNIPWLSTSIIVGERKPNSDIKSTDEERYVDFLTQVSDAVGVFIDVPVGEEVYQLQRVIARCTLDFHFVNFDDEIDPIAEEYTPISVQEKQNSLSDKSSFCATSLTIKHGKFAVSTSHAQYAVILDICQNLIFYSSPKQKEKRERREKMRFKLQLSSERDLRGKVSFMQKSVRSTQELLKFYERKLFNYMKEGEMATSAELTEVVADLEEQIEVTKEQLFDEVEELKIIISAYKDIQQLAKMDFSHQKDSSRMVKKIDVLFNEVEWQLTREDGFLGIAKALISKFRYTQSIFKDNSGEHCFEVGNFQLKNLLPNEPYKDALIPHEINIRRHLDKSVMLRVFCRLSPAVAGIMIKEHFEVNVCPISVQFTYRFYKDIEKFFFPKSSGLETFSDNLESSEVQLGIRAAAEADISSGDAPKKEASKSKVPPPRPPPPKLQNAQQSSLRSSTRRKISSSSQSSDAAENLSTSKTKKLSQGGDEGSAGSKSKRSSRHSLADSQVSPPANSLGVNRNKSTAASFSYEDRNVNTMKERASKNQQFIYVKIPEVPVFFSYKGEKERNIEDASNFNLRLPTLEYHSRMWTWQDLFQALKKDYIQVLVPQILKEKLHLKSSGADAKPTIAQSDDTNKAKLLLGDKQHSSTKKSAKKMLFGKLLKSSSSSKSSSTEKLHEAVLPSATLQSASGSPSTTSVHDGCSTSQNDGSGKGVDPSTLENQFNRLREMGND